MKPVLKSGVILMCLVVVLAGCSTRPQTDQDSGARVWLSAPAIARSSNAPAPARTVAQSATPVAPQDQARSYADTWIPLSRWSREQHAGLVWPLAQTPSPEFALTTTNGVLVIRVNSLVAKWNGVEVFLGFKPQLIGGEPFVHVLDLEKNIEPLIRGFSLPPSTNRVVVIDPGHGGQNTGTQSVLDGVKEKEYTLDWARRLEALLATNGWQVFLTRTDDVDMDLSSRVAFAARHHADLFISLHFNSAAPSQEQSGVETYCLTPTGIPSTLTRGYADDTSLVYPNNGFDAKSLQYAFKLQRSLLTVVGNDRGVRRARFLTVLRGQHCPAVLIEGGFMSNPREARLIADPDYRQKLAEAVADVLNGSSEPKARKSEVADQTSAPARLTAIGESSSNAPASNPDLP